MTASKKTLIAARKPEGIRQHSRLGKIVAKLDHCSVCYRVHSIEGIQLAGWGQLRVEIADGLLWCRVAGEVQRPNAYEYVLPGFWLTHRGMLLMLLGLLESRGAEERLAAGETLLQPAGVADRQLKADAKRWLRR